MNRCSQCNTFVSFEQAEPEDSGSDVDIAGAYGSDGESFNDIQITGSVRLVLQCANCNEELAESDIEMNCEETFEHEVGCEIDPDSTEDVTSQDVEYTATDGSEGKGRYRKQFYGAEGSVSVSCGLCEATMDFNFSELVQASHFSPI